ncbi:renalase [Cheilinus undulatus]|uniref:renalase n=1 Tax=Cheilinus undulatus TaxID=241271 RepID=UPI001BD1DF29|nr:renalase [Cheilinus undulatus]
MSRVLIVGAGLTGSLCACLLRRELQSQVEIVVWDKARGAGGRMTTSRPPDSSCSSADLGAQYVTATAAYAKSHHSFYSELLSSGVLQPLDSPIEGLRHKDGSRDYMTPLGMGSLVKHFLSESGANLFFEHHVTGLFLRGASWEVQRKAGGSETFDAVVLTMPVPQILQLQGDVGNSVRSWFLSVTPWFLLGLENLEKHKEEVQPIILQELQKLLPDLPEPASVKCQKWRYSQVLTSVPDCPGQMTIVDRPLLVCGGDAFTHSNFDGCVESALSVLSVMKAAL